MDRHLPVAPSWKFAARALRLKPSALRELLKVAQRPDIISFAGGLPSPAALPAEALANAAARILREETTGSLQYSASEGYWPLRQTLAARLTQRGPRVQAEQIMITTGSQQALDLVGRVLIDPGDRLLIEAPTYLGAVQAFSQYEPTFVQLPTDGSGIVVDALDEAMLRDGRLLYTQPNFQNPTGRTLSRSRRYALMERVESTGLVVVEDDPYGELTYGEPVGPSLHTLAPDRVVYVGSFSKVLAPGLRVGYVVAPEGLFPKLVQAKQASDLHTAGLAQRLAYDVYTDQFQQQHVAALCERYRLQCAAMLQSLASHMPEGVSWTRPSGGMFVWVTLPEGIDATVLFDDAIAAGVAFVPGGSFYPMNARANTMRLNFTAPTVDLIEDGIRRLARVVRARMGAVLCPPHEDACVTQREGGLNARTEASLPSRRQPLLAPRFEFRWTRSAP